MPSIKGKPLAIAAAGGLAVVLGVAAFGGSPSGSEALSAMSDGVEAEFEPEAQRPRAGVVETELAVDSPIASSVARALPAGIEVVSVLDRVDEANSRGVDAVELSTVSDWAGYEVTVYRNFATEELAGLPTSENESGRLWIAATDRDLTSIYFLSGAGIGLRVAHLSPEAPAKVEELRSIATVLASDSVVVEEAAK